MESPALLEMELACHRLANHHPVLLSLYSALSSPREVFFRKQSTSIH